MYIHRIILNMNLFSSNNPRYLPMYIHKHVDPILRRYLALRTLKQFRSPTMPATYIISCYMKKELFPSPSEWLRKSINKRDSNGNRVGFWKRKNFLILLTPFELLSKKLLTAFPTPFLKHKTWLFHSVLLFQDSLRIDSMKVNLGRKKMRSSYQKWSKFWISLLH